MNEKQKKLLTSFLKDFAKNPNFLFVKKINKQFPQAEIYLVGGIVRDIFLERQSTDFDFVIRKLPAKDLEKFLKTLGDLNLVGKSFGVYKFKPKNFKLGEDIDIALPRIDHSFNTGLHRDVEVTSDPNLDLEKDLERRDFTINAMALDLNSNQLIDPFNGLEDLKNKIIKTVGDPQKRFQEDYLRMLRAVRFSTQLYFKIDQPTYLVIQKKAKEIKNISEERIQEEFNKIVMSNNGAFGLELLQKSELLKNFIPELEEGVGVTQNFEHIYEVFKHCVNALAAACKRNYSLEIRLAALFHDIAKPRTKEGEGPDSTFYEHDTVGAKMVKQILKRLKYSNEVIDTVTHLVRHHMFFYATDTVSDSGIRRLLARLGKENIGDFIQLRICDRLGMGRPKAKPFKLKELERRLHEVQLDPISVSMLKLKGDELMELVKIKPGPIVGLILNALLNEVLDDPKKNTKAYLKKRAKELAKLKEPDLKKLQPNLAEFEQEQKKEYFKDFKGVE